MFQAVLGSAILLKEASLLMLESLTNNYSFFFQIMIYAGKLKIKKI